MNRSEGVYSMEKFLRLKEGEVEIEVPYVQGQGPGKKSIAYYSRAMVISRDLTVFIIKNALKEGGLALDMLGGSGIRGLRIEKECGLKVVINDKNKKSLEFIKRNAEINNSSAIITNQDASRHIPDGLYEYIDIDPYGSPVPFIDPALKSIRNNGIIGITATDVSNFAGTYPEKTWYIYHSIPIDNYLKHEVGIRILIAYLARRAAEYSFGIYPLMSYFGGYFYRVFFRVKRGRSDALKSLALVKEIHFINSFMKIGPIWIGRLHDLRGFLIPDYLSNNDKIKKIMDISENENRLFFYSTEELGKKLGGRIPKIEKIIINLREEGYFASRTQFSPTGIKTNATLQSILKIIK